MVQWCMNMLSLHVQAVVNKNKFKNNLYQNYQVQLLLIGNDKILQMKPNSSFLCHPNIYVQGGAEKNQTIQPFT